MTEIDGPRIATGLKKDRQDALHDAIYAVAMTLLVLNLHVPQGAVSFVDFMRQLHGQLPEFYAGAIAFSVAGVMWLNNYYRSSLVVRADFTHIVLTIAAAGIVVLFPFTAQALAEYWVNPWGNTVFSWNIALAAFLYSVAATHSVRYLIPKQVDQRFLRVNLAYQWFYTFGAAIIVPALALLSPLVAVLIIQLFLVVNLIRLARIQPRFIEAHRIAQAHAEDDLRRAT